MTVVLTDWLQVVTAAGSLLSGLGLLATVATVLVLVRQTRAVQQAGVATAYQSIIGMSTNLNAQLIEHPEIFEAFRDPTLAVDGWDFEEQMRLRPRVAMVTTQQLDYFELVLACITAFPRDLQDEWRDYIRGLLSRNPYMQRALLDTDWYTAELRALATSAAGIANPATE